MRFQTGRKPPGEPLLSRLNGLTHLPVRPQTVRAVMAALTADPDGDDETAVDRVPRALLEVDPGWQLAESSSATRARSLLPRAADSAWWPATLAVGPAAEAVQRLWRHAVATALACRNLAREHDDRDPAGLIRAGLLHGLGLWAVAAVDPDWLARWMAEPDRDARRRREAVDLGADLRDVGRRIAERWGCEPLVVDAAWLHGEDDAALDAAAREPRRLALVREAVRRAESTPWALDSPEGREPGMPAEPHLRILVAEVQSRCASPFAADDATPHEERMTRENARLRLRLAELSRTEASQRRLIEAIADSATDEDPEGWSLRAGRMWCGEPEVNAARVVWRGSTSDPGEADPLELEAEPEAAESARRGASWTIPLEAAGEAVGEVQLWLDGDVDALRDRLRPTRVVDAWKAWAAHVADRDLLERRLRAAVEGCRASARAERGRIQAAKLEALAEFAAGAGHELNNPLAVIVGRAQLLMAQAADPDAERSLGIILGQARRTHRILRDLMFVARPSEPRPRLCRPAEVLRGCLADFEAECESRGIRLEAAFDEPELQAWIDPEGLRHVAEVLLRNAIQASAATGGGGIQVRAGRQGRELRLWVADSGKGVGDAEAVHLFDPFFCGRQAGRGLGLGLPRAARIVERAGGALSWTSTPGQGSVFQVRLPWGRPPEEAAAKSA